MSETTQPTQLDKLNLQIDFTNEDDLRKYLLECAEEFILTYTNREVLPDKLLLLQRQIAVIYYNRLGVEGEQGRSEGGISSTIYVLNDDMPTSIKAQLNAYRLAKAVRYANQKT